jgi:hypothetical protein
MDKKTEHGGANCRALNRKPCAATQGNKNLGGYGDIQLIAE